MIKTQNNSLFYQLIYIPAQKHRSTCLDWFRRGKRWKALGRKQGGRLKKRTPQWWKGSRRPPWTEIHSGLHLYAKSEHVSVSYSYLSYDTNECIFHHRVIFIRLFNIHDFICCLSSPLSIEIIRKVQRICLVLRPFQFLH